MSKEVQKVVASAHALLERLYPGVNYDDQRIFDDFIAPSEASLSVALGEIQSSPRFDEFSQGCLDLVRSSFPELEQAFRDADADVERLPSQLGDSANAVLMNGAAITALGGAYLFMIVLAFRVWRTKPGSRSEPVFAQGNLPAVKVFEMAGRISKIEDILRDHGLEPPAFPPSSNI